MDSLVSMLSSGSYMYFQLIVILSALALKMYYPNRINDINDLNKSILLIVISILVLPIGGFISSIFKFAVTQPDPLKSFFGGASKLFDLFQVIAAALVAYSVYTLWNAINFEPPAKDQDSRV